MRTDYPINKILRDDFGRPSGLLALNKPSGFTSHDLVNVVRRALDFRKVGHAGALDPFATGVMYILVGKATKASDYYMHKSKQYQADVLFGVSTTTQDPEGDIDGVDLNHNITKQKVELLLSELKSGYQQFVPVYSSVKVDGQKLRVLARRSDSFKTYYRDGQKYATFKHGDSEREVALPQHHIDFDSLKLDKFSSTQLHQIATDEYTSQFVKKLQLDQDISDDQQLKIATITTDCPKGTYIRQLAEDIGEKLEPSLPAMLTRLVRTRLGDTSLDQALSIEQLDSL